MSVVWLNQTVPLWAVRMGRAGRRGPDRAVMVLTSRGALAAKDVAREVLPSMVPIKSEYVTKPLLCPDMREIEPLLNLASQGPAHSRHKRSAIRLHKVDFEHGCAFVLTTRNGVAVQAFINSLMPASKVVAAGVVTSPVVIADWDAANKAANDA